VEIPGAGAKLGRLGAECCHLVGEILDSLQARVAVAEQCSACMHLLGCGHDDAVCTAARGIHVTLGLASESGPYIAD
jgi:hypothetical protein